MARIKHVALRTWDVEKTAAFYKEVFGLKQAGVGRSGIYLSDGHINLAILKHQPDHPGWAVKLGLDHFGFQVEDPDATITRLTRLGGKLLREAQELTRTDPSVPQSYNEIKCEGPDQQALDLSIVGWAGTD